MANRYWVLGSGTWNTSTTTNWSATSGGLGGASAPTASDTVIFDNNSNVLAGAFTVTVSAAVCLDMTFGTGASALDGAMTLAMGTSTLGVSGNWTNPASNFSYSGTGTINFLATSSVTITSNNIAFLSALTFNGVGGSWQLQDALTTNSARTTTLTNGTIDLNNKTLSTGLFVSSNSNTRSIAFGTGNITVTGNAATIFNIVTGTGFTYTGTPTINATYSGATGTRTIAFPQVSLGGTETNALDLNISAGSDIVTFGGASRQYRNINFTGFTGTYTNTQINIFGNLTFSAGMTVGAGTAAVSFVSTLQQQNITTNNQTLDFPMGFGGTNTYAFQDALTQGSTRAFTLGSGTLKLKSGVTSTVGSFSASNSTFAYLQSTTAGSQATISQATGTVAVAYLNIKDSNAIGGASWTAYTDYENIDAGNNDGWDFSISPPYATYEPPIIIRSFTQPRRF